MSINGVEHHMPDGSLTEAYYHDICPGISDGQATEFAERARKLEGLLKRWDDIMNDPDIPAAVKDAFRLRFNGEMNRIENIEKEYGPSSGEGFDDILKALEEGDSGVIGDVISDGEDFDELCYGFSKCFDEAKQSAAVEEPTEASTLAKFVWAGDWEGLKRYHLEHKQDNQDG